MKLKVCLLVLLSFMGVQFTLADEPTPGATPNPASGNKTQPKSKKGKKSGEDASSSSTATPTSNENSKEKGKERIKAVEAKYNFLNSPGHNIVWSYNQGRALWNQRSVQSGDTITFRVVDYDKKDITISVIGTVVQSNLTAFYNMANYFSNSQGITETAPSSTDNNPVTYTSFLPILATGKAIYYSMMVVDNTNKSKPVTFVQNNFYKVWVDGNTVESSFGILGVFNGPGQNGPGDLFDFSHYSFSQKPACYFTHFYIAPGHPLAIAATAGLAGSQDLNLGLFLGGSLFFGDDIRAVLSVGTSVWGQKTYPSLGFSIAGF